MPESKQTTSAAWTIKMQKALAQAGMGSCREMEAMVTELLELEHGHEIWQLYERGLLHTDAPLTGRYQHDRKPVDVAGVLREVDDARSEEAMRQLRMQSR